MMPPPSLRVLLQLAEELGRRESGGVMRGRPRSEGLRRPQLHMPIGTKSSVMKNNMASALVVQ